MVFGNLSDIENSLRAFITPRIRGRRFQAFCVGAMKTGTNSVARLLDAGYRAAHEPRTEELIDAVMAADMGAKMPVERERYIIERDRPAVDVSAQTL